MATGACGEVLVVEDDAGMSEAIESLLTAAGFRSRAYGSAEALLAADAVEHALCVITDIELPRMTGLALLAALQRRAVCPPVIVITGHDAPGMRAESARLGAVAYLPKPFEGSTLLQSISHAIDRRSPAIDRTRGECT